MDRYVTPSAQYVTIESGQTATVHFSNILKKFRVHVVKTDADTGTAQGDATLAGAAYGIYCGGELVDTYTTDADGSFLTRYYVCGDNWTVREIEPSTGYLLNDTVYSVGAEPSLYEVELNTAENQVTETVIYGNIQLVKHTDELDGDVSEDENTAEPNEGIVEQPEAGAVFEIYLKAAGSYENAKESLCLPFGFEASLLCLLLFTRPIGVAVDHTPCVCPFFLINCHFTSFPFHRSRTFP